ncbi:hypothetical protein D3C75_1016330 [compost metagenome]
MQIFDEFTGVVGERISDFYQPVTAINRPLAIAQFINHLIDRVDLAMAGGDNHFIGDIDAERHQLIGP